MTNQRASFYLLTNQVLEDNFSDQEGRLVCLVCYKLLGTTQI